MNEQRGIPLQHPEKSTSKQSASRFKSSSDTSVTNELNTRKHWITSYSGNSLLGVWAAQCNRAVIWPVMFKMSSLGVSPAVSEGEMWAKWCGQNGKRQKKEFADLQKRNLQTGLFGVHSTMVVWHCAIRPFAILVWCTFAQEDRHVLVQSLVGPAVRLV